MYEYKAKLVRVIDGDTIVVMVDLGFNVHTKESIRLLNTWAPERYTRRGKLVRLHTIYHLAMLGCYEDGEYLTIQTEYNKSFDRYLAHIFIDDIYINGVIDDIIARVHGLT